MNRATKFFLVLGVSHRVQGNDFVGAFPDPDYAAVVSEIISNNHMDFVGEECSVTATVAENIAQNQLGVGHYLNVDPVLEGDRKRNNIGETCFPPGLCELPVYRWIVAENEKRERIWIDRLVERTTKRGLLICRFFHAFSVASKLLNRGFEVEARTYIPWEKLAS
jgi:hypothetical protein